MTLKVTRAESSFDDFKPALTGPQAFTEASRCLFCSDAPCIQACPTEIDIPGFIRRITTDNLRGSAKAIFDANILGMSCARVCPVETLCVGDCVYNEMGVPPIQIGKLQRFVTDTAFDKEWRFHKAGPDSGKSIGLVGGGPASLAAAHMLRRLGHHCTIYDRASQLGGLNRTGVAPYKMKADRALEEVDWILSIGGIDLELGVEIGSAITFAELETRHDALFLGFGLGPDSRLGAEGEALGGVRGAVDFIEDMKLNELPLDGVERAVIVGGGNTAIDAVRECLGLGIPSVTMVYRRDEDSMSGYAHEWREAKQEGARALWRHQPLSFEGTEGRVQGLRCVALDDDRRPVEGSEQSVPADLVLLAIGQGRLEELIADLDGIERDRGRIVTDEEGATGRSGYFAAGDCRNGGKEVVNAAGEGKRAARAIDAYLKVGGSLRAQRVGGDHG